MTSENMESADLQEQIAVNEGMTIVFGEDNTVTITDDTSVGGMSVVQKGTYSLSGQEVEITVTEILMGGQTQSVELTIRGTISGVNFSYELEQMPGTSATVIFILAN